MNEDPGVIDERSQDHVDNGEQLCLRYKPVLFRETARRHHSMYVPAFKVPWVVGAEYPIHMQAMFIFSHRDACYGRGVRHVLSLRVEEIYTPLKTKSGYRGI